MGEDHCLTCHAIWVYTFIVEDDLDWKIGVEGGGSAARWDYSKTIWRGVKRDCVRIPLLFFLFRLEETLIKRWVNGVLNRSLTDLTQTTSNHTRTRRSLWRW